MFYLSGLLKDLEKEIDEAALEPSRMSEILGRHLPAVFPDCQIQVRIFPDLDVFACPSKIQHSTSEPAWKWLQAASKAGVFHSRKDCPWPGEKLPPGGLVLAPIPSTRGGAAIGGVSLACSQGGANLEDLLPAAQSLSTVLAPALSRMQDMVRWLAQQRTIKELEMAARIQASILPDKPPVIRGWDIAATLKPAHETSGDFFDFIPLEYGKWGILIADVTDKGLGAALFMAMCSSLIRTYAVRFPTLPSVAIRSVNERIFSDTRGSLFVTVFYGILEPEIARLRYVNAGHNPPLLLSARKSKPYDRLQTTGMALGISEDTNWQQKIIKFAPGDTLVLYTDGITEAQDKRGRLFGEQRLLDVARQRADRPARQLQESILEEVRRFSTGAPEQDDIALIVIARNPTVR